MRSSRVSQDTARILKALAPRTGSSSSDSGQRRSLRQSGRSVVAIPTDIEDIVKHEQRESSVSSLSSPDDVSSNDEYAGVEDEDDEEEAPSNNAIAISRKRKRGADTPATSINSISYTAVKKEPARRSSRKAHELEDQSDAGKKPRRQPAKHVKSEGSPVRTEAPSDWEEIYVAVAAMRKLVLAPVDTMGCESLAEASRSPQDQRLQTLIALMLSSQTKDTVTAAAMRNLQANLPDGQFNLDSLLTVPPERLNQLIEKVGFHNNKTKFIKATAVILAEKFGRDIPDTIEGLVSLPGVGPKMAYLTMSAAWGRDEGIGVDVHVHRITNLWHWHKTRTPEETRLALQSWLPRDKWHDINHLLVGFGQTTCLPIGRRCGECTLAASGLCPSAVIKTEIRKRTKKEVIVKDEAGEGVLKEEVSDDVEIKLEKADPDAPPLDVELQPDMMQEPVPNVA